MTDKFLSTPSARRATTCCRCGAACGAYFYPRPPRGGRRSAAGLEGQAGRFLSTPSARRATPMSRSICARRSKFLSTPSARRATYKRTELEPSMDISIHALREEGDLTAMMSESIQHISIHALREEGDTQAAIIPTAPRYFYPRPPRGGRLGDVRRYFNSTLFLSTPSARRATTYRWSTLKKPRYFYPRPPRGGRLLHGLPQGRAQKISIHALREEGDISPSTL